MSNTIKASDTDTVTVDVNVDVKHILGEVSSFDRNKFVTIHADVGENEWDDNYGPNFTDDLRDHFLNGYDVYLGRNTGGLSWQLNYWTKEDPAREGFADPANIVTNATREKNNYAAKTEWHPYEHRNDQILCAQLHPFWPDGQKMGYNDWAFSQTDTDEEPFGTATGEFMGRYLKEYYGTGGTTGNIKPKYCEVINEPLWHLVDMDKTNTPEEVFEFHNAVSKEIKKYNDDVLVGGFCTAFPDIEKNNFQQWEERWKLYMDIAGENSDYWTIHLYDFPSINNGKQKYRKGAQMEATFDMMEQYSYLLFDEVKPFMISEYGAQMHDYFGAWSPYRDWLHLKSVNSMMMQFMSRANIINKTINFLPVKADWGTNGANDTYNHRLLRRENEPASYTGTWVYSEMVQTYELWKDVKGIRVDSKPNVLDVLTDSYVDGNKVYVIVNSLDLTENYKVKVNIGIEGNAIQSLKAKHHHLNGTTDKDSPVITEEVYNNLPEAIEIAPEATLVLEYTFADDVVIDETSNEVKYYATEYYKPIAANTANHFEIKNVSTSNYGEAILRIGVGRNHGKEIYPSIDFNGVPLDVIKDYKGDDQKDRDTFFGVLEVAVPYELLDTDNNISVKFSDDGGYISSVALQAFSFSREIDRTQQKDTAVKPIKQSEFSLKPNPASSFIEVSSSGSQQIEKLELFTVQGQKILSQNINQSNSRIPIGDYADGVYVVLVHSKTGLHSQKILIRR